MRHLLILLAAIGLQDVKPLPACKPNYALGNLTDRINADDSITFTQAAVKTNCVRIPDVDPAGCEFCFVFQLTKQYKQTNIWEVVPPYPQPLEIHVGCPAGQTKTYSTTTPALGVGNYEMEADLFGSACELHMGGVVTIARTIKVQIR